MKRLCFSIAHQGPVHGYCKAGLRSCFSLFSPKSVGAASAGHPDHAPSLRITAITVGLCLGVSLPRTFPYSARPQVGLERGAHSKPSWGKEKDLSWGAGELLWGSQALQHVLQLSPYMITPSFTSCPLTEQGPAETGV